MQHCAVLVGTHPCALDWPRTGRQAEAGRLGSVTRGSGHLCSTVASELQRVQNLGAQRLTNVLAVVMPTPSGVTRLLPSYLKSSFSLDPKSEACDGMQSTDNPDTSLLHTTHYTVRIKFLIWKIYPQTIHTDKEHLSRIYRKLTPTQQSSVPAA